MLIDEITEKSEVLTMSDDSRNDVDMSELLQRLESALAKIPGAMDELHEGAPDDAVAEAEAALNVTLPDDFRYFCRRYDGQTGILFLFHSWRLWPLAQIVATRAGGAEEWLYIGDDGGASTLALDVSTGPQRGRVVGLLEDGTEAVAPSFDAFLAQVADGLDDGTLVFDTEAGTVVSPDEAAQVARDLETGRQLAEGVRDSLSVQEINRLPPGAEVEIVGMLDWTDASALHELRVRGGLVTVRGSLGDVNEGEDYAKSFRVKVRVGKRRMFGLGSPTLEILEYQRM